MCSKSVCFWILCLQDLYVRKIVRQIPVWSFQFISLEKQKTEFTCGIKAAIVSM